MNASPNFSERQLALLATKCGELAERVAAGQIGFIDAIDMAYSAAIWSGLTESVGDNAVQDVIANAFTDTPRRAK